MADQSGITIACSVGELIWNARAVIVSMEDMAQRAIKYGLAFIGLGLLSFLLLVTAMGGMGPCATDGQAAALLLGFAGIGIGGLICLVSVPVVIVRKFKARNIGSNPSLP